MKVKNSEGTQYTLENLPDGTVIEVSMTGVNDAGEGQASAPVTVTVV